MKKMFSTFLFAISLLSLINTYGADKEGYELGILETDDTGFLIVGFQKEPKANPHVSTTDLQWPPTYSYSSSSLKKINPQAYEEMLKKEKNRQTKIYENAKTLTERIQNYFIEEFKKDLEKLFQENKLNSDDFYKHFMNEDDVRNLYFTVYVRNGEREAFLSRDKIYERVKTQMSLENHTVSPDQLEQYMNEVNAFDNDKNAKWLATMPNIEPLLKEFESEGHDEFVKKIRRYKQEQDSCMGDTIARKTKTN